VVICVTSQRRIKTVDHVRTLNRVLLEVLRPVGLLGISPNDVQGLVAVVAGEALLKTAPSAASRISAAPSHGIVRWWRDAARLALSVGVSTKSLVAVIRELGRWAASANWAAGLSYAAFATGADWASRRRDATFAAGRRGVVERVVG